MAFEHLSIFLAIASRQNLRYEKNLSKWREMEALVRSVNATTARCGQFTLIVCFQMTLIQSRTFSPWQRVSRITRTWTLAPRRRTTRRRSIKCLFQSFIYWKTLTGFCSLCWVADSGGDNHISEDPRPLAFSVELSALVLTCQISHLIQLRLVYIYISRVLLSI